MQWPCKWHLALTHSCTWWLERNASSLTLLASINYLLLRLSDKLSLHRRHIQRNGKAELRVSMNEDSKIDRQCPSVALYSAPEIFGDFFLRTDLTFSPRFPSYTRKDIFHDLLKGPTAIFRTKWPHFQGVSGLWEVPGASPPKRPPSLPQAS